METEINDRQGEEKGEREKKGRNKREKLTETREGEREKEKQREIEQKKEDGRAREAKKPLSPPSLPPSSYWPLCGAPPAQLRRRCSLRLCSYQAGNCICVSHHYLSFRGGEHYQVREEGAGRERREGEERGRGERERREGEERGRGERENGCGD